MEDKIFKSDAKSIVDICFDNKLFKDEITRDDMSTFEDLIGFMLQARFDSYKRMSSLMDKIEKRKSNANN